MQKMARAMSRRKFMTGPMLGAGTGLATKKAVRPKAFLELPIGLPCTYPSPPIRNTVLR